MSNFEAGLCTVTFRTLPPDRIVELAREARLAATEWAGDAHLPPGNTSIARIVGRLSKRAGLTTSYGSYVAPPTDDLSEFVRAVESATALALRSLQIGAPDPSDRRASSEKPRERAGGRTGWSS